MTATNTVTQLAQSTGGTLGDLLGRMPAHLPLRDLVSHVVLDVLALAVLATIYRRQRNNPEMLFTLGALNIGLFATLIAISGDAFSTGAGFGLFGMLSLIRLRSASFTTVDMGYSFVTLVLGLVMGIVALPLVVSAGVAAALLALVAVGDHPRVNPATQLVVVVLDRAHPSVAAARRDVIARLHLPVVSLTIDEVDYVRETTKVTVRCGTAVAVPTPPGLVRTPSPRRQAAHSAAAELAPAPAPSPAWAAAMAAPVPVEHS